MVFAHRPLLAYASAAHGIGLFCDPNLGNNILSRLHKIYIVGYKVTHHLSSVFDW